METNKNAEQFLTSIRLKKSSRYANWVLYDSNKIKLFLGLLIGIIHKTRRLLE